MRKQWEEVKQAVKKPTDAKPQDRAAQKATTAAADRLSQIEARRVQEDDWWSWQLKAKREPDPARREHIYREALDRLPNSKELAQNFAILLKNVCRNYDEAERFYQRALEIDPNHAIITGNFASFLTNIRKSYDEAEKRYRRALEIDPKDATITGNFASFLAYIRKEYDEAERLYRRALELDPSNGRQTGNFTGFLIARRRAGEARGMSDRAWSLLAGEASHFTAEAALFRGVLLRMSDQNDTLALGRLRTLFDSGFLQLPGTLDDELAGADEALSDDDKKLYAALAAAILDADRVAALDEFPRWRQVKPIPLDEPWPPLADNAKGQP